MKKRTFDLIILLVIGLLLVGMEEIEALEKLKKFNFIIILTFYYIGQYAERKFKN